MQAYTGKMRLNVINKTLSVHETREPNTESLGYKKESKEIGKEKPRMQEEIRKLAVSGKKVDKVFQGVESY